jgi:pimeloyl-ACP methyl ester carboxylesterase
MKFIREQIFGQLIQEKSIRSMLFYEPRVELGKKHELVIVIHGMAQSAYNTDKLSTYIRTVGGYSTFRMDLSMVFGSFDNLMKEVKEQLDLIKFGLNFDKVHFIGHSMGGMVARKIISTWRFDNIGKFIALGTPYGGSNALKNLDKAISKIADYIYLVKYYDEMIKQFTEGIPKNNSVEIGLIAGKKDFSASDISITFGETELQFRRSNLKKPHDGAVEVASVFAISNKISIKDKIIANKNHFELINDDYIFKKVVKFLNTGSFK